MFFTTRSFSVYPLVNVYIAMERSTMLLMGKSTISTGPFSIAMLVHQRVIKSSNQNCNTLQCLSAWRYLAMFKLIWTHCTTNLNTQMQSGNRQLVATTPEVGRVKPDVPLETKNFLSLRCSQLRSLEWDSMEFAYIACLVLLNRHISVVCHIIQSINMYKSYYLKYLTQIYFRYKQISWTPFNLQ